jgi:hypothetical protein
VAASKYRIVLRGRLSERFESAFEGMTLEHGPNQTVLVGDVRDQAQLYGLLDRVRDFGIELLAVEPADISDGSSGPGAGRLASGLSVLPGADPPGPEPLLERSQPRIFTALASTSAMAATEMADWSIIMVFAQRVSGDTSLAEKETERAVYIRPDYVLPEVLAGVGARLTGN